MRLLNSPNIASKESVYRQYDHQVQTNTIAVPGGDAAVMRIKGTARGIALSTDGNGRYCYLDPYAGGMIAVAEACRNVSCTGAEPIALTNCLNFGNPEHLNTYYQLENCIRGMATASDKLGAPVISGNVSLYNESHGESIYPTPVVGALGLLENVDRQVGIGFVALGDRVVILGSSNTSGAAADLAGSEYLETIHGLVVGHPFIDIELEVAVQRTCRRLIDEGIARSAHDCSDGGLAVTLAECCIVGQIGLNGSVSLSGRWDAALFGELQSRIVVSLMPDALSRFERICTEEKVPWLSLGEVCGESLSLEGILEVSVLEMANSWQNGLGSIMPYRKPSVS